MPDKKPIHCIGCHKIIAEGVMMMGSITINCRDCKTATTIQAEQIWLPVEPIERKTLINFIARIGLEGLKKLRRLQTAG